uniref:BTB domain-containing protein n=1 Tax=Haemonchus contortus TaxID=6289 RepID=A0A7I4YP70_HAECO
LGPRIHRLSILTMDLRLILENPEKTTMRRNRNADRCLKLEDSSFRIHQELLHSSPVLERLLMKGARTMLHLDHLKMDQKCFTPLGLNLVIDWIYGIRIEFSTEHITDALAASFALEMYDMVEAIEEEILKYQGDPDALVILLYHIDNFTPETKQQLLTASAKQIAAVSQLRPFVGLPTSIFKRVIKIAMNRIAEIEDAFNVARAIIIWTGETQNRNLAMNLLKQIDIQSLPNNEAYILQRMADEAGMECLASLFFNRFHFTSAAARRLFGDETESSRTTAIISEQNAVWEHPKERNGRLPAGKNMTEVKVQEQEKKEILPTSWQPTPEERYALREMISRFDTVHFGRIPFDETTHDFHVEIIYEGIKEATKADAVKLFFDFEFEPNDIAA